MNNTYNLIMALSLAAAFTACKKDDPAPTAPVNPTPTDASIKLEFEFMNGMMPFASGDTLVDSANRKVIFDKVRFYASNAHLLDMGGNEVAHYEDVYMLVDAANPTNLFDLGTVSPGHIHEVAFNVGLDSLTNHADPMTAAAPLNDATMHWGWSPAAGYKFIVMEGRVDTDGNGTVDPGVDAFVYHIATDALLGEKVLMVHTDVTAGNTTTFAVHVDMAGVAGQVDVLNNLDTHTSNNIPLAIQMRDALLTNMTAH